MQFGIVAKVCNVPLPMLPSWAVLVGSRANGRMNEFEMDLATRGQRSVSHVSEEP